MSRRLFDLSLAATGLIALGTLGLHPAQAGTWTSAAADAALASQAAPKIAPHRAVYSMKLASTKNGSNVAGVSGRMVFEWRDLCDAWVIQQRMQLHFAYTDMDDQDIESAELTWESKDGKRYNFNIRRAADGQETEAFRGKAVQNADGSVTVNYTLPENKIQTLPAGTLFPTAHTELILKEAEAGEKLFSRRVFDGSDEDGSSEISAFILPKRPAEDIPSKTKLKKSPLLKEAAWPVHLAFFKLTSETGEPDYEMDIHLLPNGVARRMKVDYGDFSVAGDLEEVQALPAQKCP